MDLFKRIKNKIKTKFCEYKNDVGKDPVKHCEHYNHYGCSHVDGYLCPCEEMEEAKQ